MSDIHLPTFHLSSSVLVEERS